MIVKFHPGKPATNGLRFRQDLLVCMGADVQGYLFYFQLNWAQQKPWEPCNLTACKVPGVRRYNRKCLVRSAVRARLVVRLFFSRLHLQEPTWRPATFGFEKAMFR